MSGKKLLGIVGLLLALLIVPVFSILGVVDVSQLSFFAAPAQMESSSSTPMVFADPTAISDDTLQTGSYFTVHVNISGVTDLFAWQINMSWDPSILNASRVIPSEFLARSVNLTSSEILGFVINYTGSVVGAEAIMADTTGITGSGRLVTIEFLVVGYGSTDLTISLTGTLPTTLLNSTILPNGESGTISFTKTDGYFRNKYPGDVDGDYYVGSADASVLSGAYGTSAGDPAYDREADFNLDGYVGSGDASVLSGNYGKTFP